MEKPEEIAALEKKGYNYLGKISEGRLESMKPNEKVIRSRKKGKKSPFLWQKEALGIDYFSAILI